MPTNGFRIQSFNTWNANLFNLLYPAGPTTLKSTGAPITSRGQQRKSEGGANGGGDRPTESAVAKAAKKSWYCPQSGCGYDYH
jgi:hypothetical protein